MRWTWTVDHCFVYSDPGWFPSTARPVRTSPVGLQGSYCAVWEASLKPRRAALIAAFPSTKGPTSITRSNSPLHAGPCKLKPYEGVVRAFLELQQPGAVRTALGSLFHTHRPLVKNLLTPSLALVTNLNHKRQTWWQICAIFSKSTSCPLLGWKCLPERFPSWSSQREALCKADCPAVPWTCFDDRCDICCFFFFFLYTSCKYHCHSFSKMIRSAKLP